jgi:hypothetical protein
VVYLVVSLVVLLAVENLVVSVEVFLLEWQRILGSLGCCQCHCRVAVDAVGTGALETAVLVVVLAMAGREI